MVATAESLENRIELMMEVEKRLGRTELMVLEQSFPNGVVDEKHRCLSIADLTSINIKGMEWPVKVIVPKRTLLGSEIKIDPRASNSTSVMINIDGAEVDYLYLPATLTLTPWNLGGEWKLDRTDSFTSFGEIRKVVRDFGKTIQITQGCPMNGNKPKLQELFALVGCKGVYGKRWQTSQNVMVVGV